MKHLIPLVALFLIIGLSSCEDVIQVKLDKGEPIITIDAFINNLPSAQKIRLTKTSDYFSQGSNVPISDASVKITDIDTDISYMFNEKSAGNYVYEPSVSDNFCKIGHRYELTVTYQGQTFTATTRLNRTTKIDSLIAKYEDGGGFGNGETGYRFSFLGFDIPGDTIDYYWIKSYKNGVFFNKGSNINICIDAAYGNGADGFPFIPPIAEGITPFGELFNKNDTCRVEIHSINRETFNFLTQVQNQTTNSGLFATNPENIKTNIRCTSNNQVKVIGWFEMSSANFREKITP